MKAVVYEGPFNEGRTSVEQGKILGHENMGVVTEVGRGVTWVRPGDRVSVPFNIACGTCRNCMAGWTSFCLRTNPVDGVDGAAYGYAQMGPYDGGQAEYLRVPFADFNLLELPDGTEFENDRRAVPSLLVSHELPLEAAPEAYQKFDRRVDGYTKVLLHPNSDRVAANR